MRRGAPLRLTRAWLVPCGTGMSPALVLVEQHVDLAGQDDACRAHWLAVRGPGRSIRTARHQNDDPANAAAEAKFAFANGSTVDASQLGCLIGAMYETHPK